jgi:hypothetical protein
MLDVAEVVDSGDHPDVVPGDVVGINTLTAFKPEANPVETPIHRCVGRTLAKDYGELRKGHVLTEADVQAIASTGIKNLLVMGLPPKYKTRLVGVAQLPVTGTKDPLAMAGAHGIKDAMTTGASQLWRSSVHGVHPIAPLIIGTEFGEKDFY